MFAIDLMSRLHIVVLRCYMFLSCRKGACILKEKDIVEKSLEDYDDVFADIVNGLLFEGENTVDPDGLVEQHPASYYRSHGIAWLTDEEIKRFKSDFRIVANFFAKRRKNPNYVPDDMTEMIHPDEVLSLIASASGDERYFHVIEANEKGKVKNMCEVADRLWNGGREEGIKEGEKRGIIKILRDLVDDGTLSITEAAKRSGMSAAAFKAAIKNI